jgi:hypothetical protein
MSDYLINFTDLTKGSILIKPYTSNGPLTPASEVPLYGTGIAADTSLVLVGKGFPNYGEIMQENLLRTMEHFAYPTPPKFPIEGQVWYRNDTKEIFVCTDPSNGVELDRWSKIALSTLTGDLDMDGFLITNLGDATNPLEAVNLQTADSRYVNTAGDTMTGTLTVSSGGIVISTGTINVQAGASVTIVSAPSAATHATNKSYVDNKIFTDIAALGAVYVDITGDTMTGALTISSADLILTNSDLTVTGSAVIDVGTNRITNVGDPINPQDAATKNWVLTQSGIAGADGVVTGGTFSSITNSLTLNRSQSLPDIIIPGIAAAVHTHTTSNVTHDLSIIPYGTSTVQEQLVAAPGFPSVSLYTTVQTLDATVSSITADTNVSYSDGDGVTTTFSVPLFVASSNKLFVTVNGIKQYASQRAGLFVELLDSVSAPVNLHTITGLTVGSYDFDIIVDGTTYLNQTITVATTPYRISTLQTDLQSILNTNAVPVSVKFSGGGFKFRSDTSGHTSQVWIQGDTLFSAIATALGGSATATLIPEGSEAVITDVDTGTDTFEIAGNLASRFPTGARFVVTESTGNDAAYTVIAPGATHSLGFTSIPVAAVADATVDGLITFNRTYGYFEVGPAFELATQVTFNTAPANGDTIEFIRMS